MPKTNALARLYTEALGQQDADYEQSHSGEAILFYLGFFKDHVPDARLRYEGLTKDGRVEFAADFEHFTRTVKEVTRLVRKGIDAGIVPEACVSALQDIRDNWSSARETRLAPRRPLRLQQGTRVFEAARL